MAREDGTVKAPLTSGVNAGIVSADLRSERHDMERPAFELRGRVEAVLVAAAFGESVSKDVEKIQAICRHGIKGDRHAGARLADVREKELLAFGLPKGMEIANHREFSVVSTEELAEIAAAMKLSSPIPYGCLGENLVVSGIPKLTQLPTGTLFFFRDGVAMRTAILAAWNENTPCVIPGETIQALFPDLPGLAALFPKAAMSRRGLVGSVYASGLIKRGDEVVVKVPRQRTYGP